MLTGLRKGELASLTIGQLELDGHVAYAVLNAADEKAGRGAEIPLRSDLVADLRGWLGERLDAARAAAKAKGLPLPARLPDDAPLFNVPADLVRAFDRDLRVAGIPKRDDRGRVLDIHALRHTFGTHLSKGGVAPRVAQAAMRHSTLELTMNTYTDPRLLDVAGALDALPELPPIDRPDTELARVPATGTTGEADSRGLPKPVLSEENAARPGDFLYRKAPAEAGNRGVAPGDCGICAPRNLVPMLVPTFGKTCTNGSQAGTSGDDRLSGGTAVSAMMDADCGTMSHHVEQRATGLEPATFSLEG
ncbi:MAG: tyrosine-type recombinase/integrase [Planctomycetota bacterium]